MRKGNRKSEREKERRTSKDSETQRDRKLQEGLTDGEKQR